MHTVPLLSKYPFGSTIPSGILSIGAGLEWVMSLLPNVSKTFIANLLYEGKACLAIRLQ